ncbi:MAG TPA: AMP-binding protein, partial [Anaeromyxobacteraceae bacterium]|nr:AMP-binding protein [Anaeromyxobacteraceae bacterium]
MIAREEVERAEARPPHSLVDILESTAARLAGRAAAKQKCEGRWVDTTWSELAQRARNVADGLASLGVKKGERVAILGESSVEWIIADLGGMGAAAVTVPIYQSSLPHECRYILEHSGACYVFCDGQSQVDKIREVRSELPALKGIIRFAGTARDDFERTLDSLERAGVAFRAGNEDAHAARLAGLSLSEPASFIYTSGTTGKP